MPRDYTREAAAVFAALEEAASRGDRCPTNDALYRVCGTTADPAIGLLCERGDIRIFVCGRNWRTVKILRGPHAGAMTRHRGDAVYAVNDQGGFRRLGESYALSELLAGGM